MTDKKESVENENVKLKETGATKEKPKEKRDGMHGQRGIGGPKAKR